MAEYVVRQGECLNSIAASFGFRWQTLWNDPSNASLKAKRKDPNILFPGDVIHIPDNDPKSIDGSTGQRHRFKVEANRCKLRVRLLYNNQPRREEPYQLSVDGTFLTGNTDGDGWLEQPIASGAQKVILILPNKGEQHSLLLGHMDPITTISGIQKRLQNLGFYIGERTDGIFGPRTASGVKAFQRESGLVEDGVPGPKTQAKLKEVYGC